MLGCPPGSCPCLATRGEDQHKKNGENESHRHGGLGSALSLEFNAFVVERRIEAVVILELTDNCQNWIAAASSMAGGSRLDAVQKTPWWGGGLVAR